MFPMLIVLQVLVVAISAVMLHCEKSEPGLNNDDVPSIATDVNVIVPGNFSLPVHRSTVGGHIYTCVYVTVYFHLIDS